MALFAACDLLSMETRCFQSVQTKQLWSGADKGSHNCLQEQRSAMSLRGHHRRRHSQHGGWWAGGYAGLAFSHDDGGRRVRAAAAPNVHVNEPIHAFTLAPPPSWPGSARWCTPSAHDTEHKALCSVSVSSIQYPVSIQYPIPSAPRPLSDSLRFACSLSSSRRTVVDPS